MTFNFSTFANQIADVDRYFVRSESSVAQDLLQVTSTLTSQPDQVKANALQLINYIRESSKNTIGVESMLREYSLSEAEGILLMCLAESLLRVPDGLTADRLIADKIVAGDWGEYVGKGDSWLMNASSWGLFLTGKFLNLGKLDSERAKRSLTSTIRRVGEPVIRSSVKIAMAVMGKQFVLGEDLGEAFKKAARWEKEGYRYSYDMLGEGARTMADADRYFVAYADAIKSIAKAAKGAGPINGPGISIKLSALHPRYQFSQDQRVQQELFTRLMELTLLARDADINLTVDAEEADRLALSLRLIERVMSDERLGEWGGFGLAVQAYHKATPVVLNFIRELAQSNNRKMMVRLVKGAYWDFEIKHAQEGGHPNFPVYTRKETTDVSYQVCAAQLLASRDWIYPQFATHNAITTSHILAMTDDHTGFEFQRLHGMGEHLFEGMKEQGIYNGPVRIYAPVGEHEHLLAYLVRRLLENGANSSFVNKISDPSIPAEELIEDPAEKLLAHASLAHPKIDLPQRILGARSNSDGWNLELAADQAVAYSGLAEVDAVIKRLAENEFSGKSYDIFDPSDVSKAIATTTLMSTEDCRAALQSLSYESWAQLGSPARAVMLLKLADLLEENKVELAALLIREAGKLATDADAEIREAIDFCRYYAMDADKSSGRSPLGKVLCISPWNFPLAIFLGQVAATLAAGNAVLAKPSEQAMMVAKRAVELAYEAGIPSEVLQLIPTDGATAGGALLEDIEVAGIVFTGSTRTAQHIQSTVAKRGGRMPVIVAETGGQNAMIVDSTALPEQVTDDVIRSGFQSAGQRCSALRVLLVQEDIADGVIAMISGAMKELQIGNPIHPSIDVGPVIDEAALARLKSHEERMKGAAKLLYQCELPAETERGLFFPPTLYEIDSLETLTEEVFGPVVHVLRYKAADFEKVFEQVNSTGFGLTMGIHSRIDSHVNTAVRKSGAGNVYVNRNIIGAVVGVQPFGGCGLSGTGPKAGGPNYLSRFLDYAPLQSQEPKYSGTGIESQTVRGAWRELSGAERWELLRQAEGEGVIVYHWAHDLVANKEVMPGPTGELNTLELRPRATVWIDPNVQHEQARGLILLALLAGNRVAMSSNAEIPARWSCFAEHGAFELVDLPNREAHLKLLASGRFNVLVMAHDDELLAATAKVDGALPIIVDSFDQHLALQRFSHEVTVSVNTTAAGGNTALMATVD
ncbi:MAG: bifunctional proline dehydrogenase/L-glutamate gamma-semialdehyde dehydrogenase PutA [Pseudomonadales bacterium]|jgi:RHH-type proline utilization regulon transcriptional repressor/proline dehydrogenase/delta 1-pyrroline-5-carboxylate dehydrogenase